MNKLQSIIIREPELSDENQFLEVMQHSKGFHHSWVKTPSTHEEFQAYFERSQQTNQKSYLVIVEKNNIAGVFNVNEIVRGYFQNAYLGFYAVADYAGKDYMSAGLKLVLKKCFEELQLHRVEANIQPDNTKSINLVKKNRFRYEGFSPRYLRIHDKWCGHEHWAITFEEYIQDNAETTKLDSVNLVSYNVDWPAMADDEIKKIRTLLPQSMLIDIQHVGSTAIPGLSAKPIIDIQIAVASLEIAKIIVVPLLQKLGYEYWADNPDKTRMFFAKGMPPYGEKRTHHVHIVEPSSPHWTGKIAFRDYLRSHLDTAKEYEQLKIKLAVDHQHDREKYTDEKAEFVHKILGKIKK
ncbi:MAG: GNAT family N-acetyltransferase [Gammaproteobacteria bacterium]|nr:GNAT family N-acetyltransferase [Gammaproteobacteria bacterium]